MSKGPGFMFFVGAALVVGASIEGCRGTNNPSPEALGGAGESCTKTADCASGLACIGDVCVSKASIAANASDGGVIYAPEGGAVVVVSDGGGAAEAAPSARVSDLGESCSSSRDCAAGLVCIPALSGTGGTCDLASYGLKPTGKTCSGECVTGADCCELPVGILGPAIKTCQDVLTNVLMGNSAQCASADPSSPLGGNCFLYSTYCATCATKNVWSCTGNQCVYDLPCTNTGVAPDCPSETRTGRALSPFCDVVAGKCPSTPRGVCNSSGDCDGQVSADSAGSCVGGDCSCFQGACYISCASTLDCRQGYSCDATSKVCMQNGVCSSDAQCADQTGVVDAKCASGACKLPCMSDRECGASGLLRSPSSDAGGFGGKVCGSDGFCDDLGCASDADCQELNHNMNPGSNAVNFFCATPPVTPVIPAPASAITN
jgi:hypothetical protein